MISTRQIVYEQVREVARNVFKSAERLQEDVVDDGSDIAAEEIEMASEMVLY